MAQRPVFQLSDDGPDTELVRAKYAEVARKRNAFLKKIAAGTVLIAVGLTIPRLLIHRSHAHYWRKYIRGNVLTLTPKLLESSVVDQLEATQAVRVCCVVRQRIKSDHHYAEVLEACTNDADKQQATRDMTLCFLKTNDPHWVHSTITFDTVLEDQVAGNFESVIVDNELWHTPPEAAASMLASAARSLTPDGHLVLTDVSVPRWAQSSVRRLNTRTESDINMAHDFPVLLENAGLEVVEHKEVLCGFFHCIAARRKSGPKGDTLPDNH